MFDYWGFTAQDNWKNFEIQMKFWHKSDMLSCQMLSSTLTCNISNAGKMPRPIVHESKRNNWEIWKTEYANTWRNKNRNARPKQDKSFWWQFMKMQSTGFRELTGCKVNHGCLQHHHHHWRHHHHRQHNQHDVNQLFQSHLTFRIPTTSLSPWHALPSFSGWDGLPQEDFRWLQ